MSDGAVEYFSCEECGATFNNKRTALMHERKCKEQAMQEFLKTIPYHA